VECRPRDQNAPAASRNSHLMPGESMPMSDRLLRVGDHVIILSGTFERFDGTVEQIDTDAGKLVVGLNIFGRKTLHEFDLASISEHVAPFGDVPPVPRYPKEEFAKQQLLEDLPGADAVFRTSRMPGAVIWHTVSIARFGESYRVIGQWEGDIGPFSFNTPRYRPVDRDLPRRDWEQFQRLLEACRFWQLPYDDGRRFPQGRRRFCWELNGYDNGRFHRVERITEDPVCDICKCCQYLMDLAPEAWNAGGA
jgi:hypothetical protein